jgi:phosphoribosylamine--glycine ligase
MKVLILGAGAREHAMAWKLARERAVSAVVCTPGNPGIAEVAQCVPGDLANPQQMLEIAAARDVDLTVVGPELPLSLGVADVFAAAGRAIVGPSRAAAALESSKSFAKAFMERHRVPTARFRVCDTAADALTFAGSGEFGFPLVVKADGLAAGKGVVIAEDRAAAELAVRHAMLDRTFGAAGDRIVFEEFLVGEEASNFDLADGSAFVPLSSAQDHKRIFDDDRGPNTGGMGAFSPSPLITPDAERRVIDEVVKPVLAGMEAEGYPYRGFLYVGLMMTVNGPRVIEFNVRFGDPEAQVVLPMLDEDLSWLLGAAATGALPSRPARFRDEPHVGVVLASRGYPETSESDRPISGLEQAAAEPAAMVFHAGTARRDGRIVTAGGRVLTVVGRGRSHREAIDTAYRAAAHIRFDGMQMRRDIGRKALGHLRQGDGASAGS